MNILPNDSRMPPARSGVVLLVEDLAQGGHAHHQADQLRGVALEVVGQAVELAEVGDQHGPAERPEDVDAIEEVPVVDGVALQEVVEGHLGDDQDVLVPIGRLPGELRQGAS